jgi:hypothetical protein
MPNLATGSLRRPPRLRAASRYANFWVRAKGSFLSAHRPAPHHGGRRRVQPSSRREGLLTTKYPEVSPLLTPRTMTR